MPRHGPLTLSRHFFCPLRPLRPAQTLLHSRPRRRSRVVDEVLFQRHGAVPPRVPRDDRFLQRFPRLAVVVVVRVEGQVDAAVLFFELRLRAVLGGLPLGDGDGLLEQGGVDDHAHWPVRRLHRDGRRHVVHPDDLAHPRIIDLQIRVDGRQVEHLLALDALLGHQASHLVGASETVVAHVLVRDPLVRCHLVEQGPRLFHREGIAVAAGRAGAARAPDRLGDDARRPAASRRVRSPRRAAGSAGRAPDRPYPLHAVGGDCPPFICPARTRREGGLA
jgi:hypothetical protein